MSKILVCEDSKSRRRLIKRIFKEMKKDCKVVDEVGGVLEAIASGGWDAFFLDMQNLKQPMGSLRGCCEGIALRIRDV